MNQEHSIPSYPMGKANDKRIEYAGPSLYYSSMVNTQIPHPTPYHYDSYVHPQFTQQSAGSPLLSSSVGSNPRSPSMKLQEPPLLVASSSSTTTASTMTSSSVEFLNDAFAKAMSLPEAFYPEFLQYSKDTYEQSTGNRPHDKKQRKLDDDSQDGESEKAANLDESSKDISKGKVSSNELRRQIHIQSEQKRRAQIKDGFEELRNELPTCLNKKMSKVALLHKTVQHIQHLKVTQASILSELEKLVHENEQLRKFQQSILQKQALENMYTVL